MTILEISYKLNNLAFTHKHIFDSIQEIRYENIGKRPRTWRPFADFSIKDNYAFHAGGRKELQFNIGQDWINDETIFRYGVAFSLNEDRTLHNSKAEFKPLIERFNYYVLNNPNFFKDLKMWYYSDNALKEYFSEVQIIDSEMFQTDNFIFIGKYFRKDIKEVLNSDLNDILDLFDYLLPLYEYVQFGIEANQKRIARLCWNDNGWIMPSGRYGKSKQNGTHEAKFGYGHEEWLFDISKLIDGYHYGFLEPIRKQQNAFINKQYNIWLYTINGETKKRYWIGEIENVEVLDSNFADKIKEKYKKKKWLKQMEEQIKSSGANSKGFSGWEGLDLFNIRFLPANLKLNDQYYSLPTDHPIYNQSRYAFAFYKDEFNISPNFDDNIFSFKSNNVDSEKNEDNNDVPEKKLYTREPKIIEINYLHKLISKNLTNKLIKTFGKNNVTPEHPAGYGANKIDIVVRENDNLVFYEIKTYPSLKNSIREAIGQLLEYSLWTNQMKAKKLIIITQPLEDFENAKIYFKHLRDSYNLPIYYQSYDYEKDILSEMV